MTSPLRVGLIGLGSVAQTVHIPVLSALPEHFRIVAGCDVSPTLCAHAQMLIPGIRTYADYRDLLAAGGVDVIAVLNSSEYHADCTIAALDAGCHVLVEKPAALTLSDLKRMQDAEARSGRIAMVGYMRRHAGGFERMRQAIAAMPRIQHVSVRDYIGGNAYFIRQVSREVAGADVPEAAKADRLQRRATMLREAIGTDDPTLGSGYLLMCGLMAHDYSAMRDLVGIPHGVIGAAIRNEGRDIAAMFDHGDFVSSIAIGVDSVGRFDASIEVFGGTCRARIAYDTPYIRHLPITVTLESSDGDSFTTETIRDTYTDPYTRQWRAFAALVADGGETRMSLADSAEDLSMFAKVVGVAR